MLITGKSGLTQRVRESTISMAEAEQMLLDFIVAQVDQGAACLAGNSVHVDRAFLQRYMPKVPATRRHSSCLRRPRPVAATTPAASHMHHRRGRQRSAARSACAAPSSPPALTRLLATCAARAMLKPLPLRPRDPALHLPPGGGSPVVPNRGRELRQGAGQALVPAGDRGGRAVASKKKPGLQQRPGRGPQRRRGPCSACRQVSARA